MGSAGGQIDPEISGKARQLGRAIGKRDCIVLTGACPGLPHEAVLGAKEHGALVVGISPALSLHEHINYYESPYEEYDVIIFTGSGLMGREIENIRSSDIVVIMGGRSGTLGEFAIAYDEAKLIAVLQGTGGIAEHIEEIVRVINKETGAEVIYDSDPDRLVERALQSHDRRVEAGVAYRVPERDGMPEG
jgi:uncharacterized protein (TIGR00725 family)